MKNSVIESGFMQAVLSGCEASGEMFSAFLADTEAMLTNGTGYEDLLFDLQRAVAELDNIPRGKNSRATLR